MSCIGNAHYIILLTKNVNLYKSSIMNKFLLFVTAALSAVVISGTKLSASEAAQGDSKPVRTELEVKNFDSIVTRRFPENISGRGTFVGSVVEIEIIQSSTYGAELIVADEKDQDMFKVEQSGSTLNVLTGIRNYPYKYPKAREGRPHAKLILKMPSVKSISLSSSHSLVSTGVFRGKDLNISLSGTSTLSGLKGDWNNISLSLSGGSSLSNVDFAADIVECELSGAAEWKNDSVVSAEKEFSVDVSGGSEIILQRINASNVDARASGAAKLVSRDVKIGYLKLSLSGGASSNLNGTIDDSKFVLSGGADMKLAGSGNGLYLSGSGGAIFSAKQMSFREADVELSGGASATLTVTDRLSVSATRGASLDYYGNPAKVENKSSNIRAH